MPTPTRAAEGVNNPLVGPLPYDMALAAAARMAAKLGLYPEGRLGEPAAYKGLLFVSQS